MLRLVIVIVSFALVVGLHAAERLFTIDRAGFLLDTNMISLATFSNATLSVEELDGRFCLPCRFSFDPGIGNDGCREIFFSSVLSMENRDGNCRHEDAARMTVDGNRSPLPKTLQVGSLTLEVKDNNPFDVVVVASQGVTGDGSRDLVLYRRKQERYLRYLCASEVGGDYWWIRLLGKRVEYRIRPVECEGDEYVIEEDVRSRHFCKMSMTYVRRDDDFRLKKIVLMGDGSYQGGVLKADPATLEVLRDFATSSATHIENPIGGIVEKGCGILRSQRKVEYAVYERNASERFRIAIEICE